MKNYRALLNITLIFSLILSFTASANANGKNKKKVAYPTFSKRDYSTIAKNLSQKLKNDLSENNLTVKIKNIEESKIGTSEMIVKGEAVCILPNDNTELPLQFEAKFNGAANAPAEVQYEFVEGDYAPSGGEEVLMKELMNRLSRDYRTEQITIAIDGFESTLLNETEKNVKGAGEVRVGDLVWNKITFDVTFDGDNKAKKIIYKIEEH